MERLKIIVDPRIKEGLYAISESGIVVNIKSKKEIAQRKDKDGYFYCMFDNRKGRRSSVRVAQLVIKTFVGDPAENIKDPTVNHIDSNKENNHYSNLEWLERGRNSSIRNSKPVGEKNGAAVLTEEQVEEICKLLATPGYSTKDISRIFEVDRSTISNIYKRKNWKYISDKYEWAPRPVCRNNRIAGEM